MSQIVGQKRQRPVNRTQSRDKKTSVGRSCSNNLDPFKNLITQVQKDETISIPAAPAVLKSKRSSNSQSEQQTVPEGLGLLGPRLEKNQHKKTLVLDLDETLVHSSFKPPEEPDIVLPVEIEGKTCYVYVLVRPGTSTFIQEMAKYYELAIYTASLSKYADPLMEQLDPSGFCDYKLFREHCTLYNGILVKDLSQLGRKLKDIIIVDNSPGAYLFQPENALPILSWYEDKADQELLKMIPFLKELANVGDVRPFLMTCNRENYIDLDKGMDLISTYKEQKQQEEEAERKEMERKLKKSQEGKVKAEQEATAKQDKIDLLDMKKPCINNWIDEKTKPVPQTTKNSTHSNNPFKKPSSAPSQSKVPISQRATSAKRFIQSTQKNIDNKIYGQRTGKSSNHESANKKGNPSEEKKKKLEHRSKENRSPMQVQLMKDESRTSDVESRPSEHNNNGGGAMVSLVNFSSKTKLISEIRADQASLTREQIAQRQKDLNMKKIFVLGPGKLPNTSGQVQRNVALSKDGMGTSTTNTTNSTSTTANEAAVAKKSVVAKKEMSHQKNTSLNKRANRMAVVQDRVQEMKNGCLSIDIDRDFVQEMRQNYTTTNNEKHQRIENKGVQGDQTPLKYSSMTTRNGLESQCGDIGSEGPVAQVTHHSESSINRTPKSDIAQPGKIFSMKRAESNPSKCQPKSQSFQGGATSKRQERLSQPKILQSPSQHSSNKFKSSNNNNNNNYQSFKTVQKSTQDVSSHIAAANSLSIFKLNSPKQGHQLEHFRNISNPNFPGCSIKKAQAEEINDSQLSNNVVMIHKTQLFKTEKRKNAHSNPFIQDVSSQDSTNKL